MRNALLSIPHHQQKQPADCLAACAAMVLDYLGVQVTYDNLQKLLKVEPYGASAYNLHYLTPLGVMVDVDIRDLTLLKESIDSDIPVIALVKTGELSYWSQETNHVVVAVGYEEDRIFVNDPVFQSGPNLISAKEFELAWLGFDYLSAIITRME